MKLVWLRVEMGKWKGNFQGQTTCRFLCPSSWTCVQPCEGCDYRDVSLVFALFVWNFTDGCFFFFLECYQMVLRWKAAVFRFVESKICVLPKILFKQLGSLSMKVFRRILFIMFKFSHSSKFTSQILWHCTTEHRLQRLLII